MRLVAYYILLNKPELPPFIAIEEPERNLHPGALTDIANVLEQIAEHSQVKLQPIVHNCLVNLIQRFVGFAWRFAVTQSPRCWYNGTQS